MRKLSYLFVALVFVSVCTGTAWGQAQITTGTVQGDVLDERGGSVAGASVEARNLDTNFTRAEKTNSDGHFAFLNLAPGRYELKITQAGFATVLQQNVNLTVGQVLTIPVTLKISSVSQQIVVSDVPVIETSKTESSTTLNELTVSSTPVLGRKFEDLLTLTPGVAITQGPDGDEINFNGQRGVFNNISLDGGDYNNGFFGEQLGGQRAAIDIPLDAVKEFQVVATGANAEFGRTAAGVVNVISKSGTNDVHGSVFYFQRLEALAAHTKPDNKPLKDFLRSQYGGTVGGPIQRDKSFFFLSFEGIREKLSRANLSAAIGTPCAITTPTIQANEAAINASPDCQRLALLNFFRTSRTQEEGAPIQHKINNLAFLAKTDWNLNSANKLGISYNFDYSKNTNQTFDVSTYGDSANGIEGPSKINNFNVNLFSTVSATMLNEAHFSYTREDRPRSAVTSNVPADTAMDFVTTFRFGHPFFLAPNVDEQLWRTHLKDNFAIVSGNHTVKFGGEWIHTLNSQVFRGFFQGRYIFDSVAGVLSRSPPAAPAGLGSSTTPCSNGTWATSPTPCIGSTATGTPLLLFLQGAGPTGPATDAAGASSIKNEDYALFAQDRWQIRSNFVFSYGLRWEAQIFPDVTVAPASTAYGKFLSDPRFPSDGTLHSPKKEFQPRVGFAWDISKNGRSVLRASYGIFYGRQNMLSQVGSITTNGVQQQTIAGGLFANPTVLPTC